MILGMRRPNSKFFWSLADVPELAELSAKQRRMVHLTCVRRHLLFAPLTSRSAFAYGVFIFCVAVFAALGAFVQKLVDAVGNSLWFVVGGAVLGAWIGAYLFSRMAIAAVRGFYHEVISKNG
jgi:hypothetical protein